jgi:hypothetical protein
VRPAFKVVKLTADLVEAFAGMFLSPRYDDPTPTPAFHRKGWEAYCSDHPQVSLVAPRDHAKSTGFTFAYGLAEVCFRVSDYVILIGATEDMAAEQLSNIREELLENEDLRAEFGIAKFEKDSTTDVIVVCDDGHRFRMLARGAEQKIRGKMWKGKRPNLIIGDDMEDDEQVENKERRAKFRRWFFRAAKQALSKTGKIRVHGTILHEDSLLSRLQKNKTWMTLFFKAHRSFDDFSDLLWPEAWTPARLQARRQEFIEDGDAGGYSQEFLNDPQDNADAYLRKQDFIAMLPADYEMPKIVYAAADFAVSKEDLANRTSITVGGKTPQNIVCIVDERVDRWSSMEVVQDMPKGKNWSWLPNKFGGIRVGWMIEMLAVQRRWQPEFFFVEDGVIWKAIKAMFLNLMREEECPINIVELSPIKDKATRGRVFQRWHKSGMIRFDKQAEWYPGYETELLRFTGGSQATLDDQFDSSAWLLHGFEHYQPSIDEEEDFVEVEELSIREMNRRRRSGLEHGRSETTGY